MPWVRIDENAMDHPKVGGLPDGAFRLWIQGLTYCQKYLTDGQINSHALRGLRAYSPKRLKMLVVVGLFEAADDGVQVHDYLDWNDSREKVLAERATARGRYERFKQRLTQRRPNGVGDGVTNGVHSPPLHNTENQENTRAQALDGFPEFYARYPRHKKPGDAEKAWKSVKGAEKREEIMAALEKQIASGEWTDPKFILYPASWLRAKCWEDEITPTTRRGPQVLIPKPDRVDWGTECDELHGGRCGNQAAHALVMQRQKVSA